MHVVADCFEILAKVFLVDAKAETAANTDTSDLQRRLEGIDALMSSTNSTKAELPIEKFYSKTAVRDMRRVRS